MANAPSNSENRMNSGVSFELMNWPASAPAIRIGDLISAITVPQPACRSIRDRPAVPRCDRRSASRKALQLDRPTPHPASRTAGSPTGRYPPRTPPAVARDSAPPSSGFRWPLALLAESAPARTDLTESDRVPHPYRLVLAIGWDWSANRSLP